MSTTSISGLGRHTTALPLGPNGMNVVERVKSGDTSLKHHPQVADKLFVHFLHTMPPAMVRGPLDDALDWIENALRKNR